MTLTLYFDGLCEPHNPGGIACWGWLLLDESGQVIEEGNGEEVRGRGATNNVAEWAALERGLRAAVVRRPDRLEVLGDSQLAINQLTGRWQTGAAHLRPYRSRCLALLDGCEWAARWIPREGNTAADALSRVAYTAARRARR